MKFEKYDPFEWVSYSDYESCKLIFKFLKKKSCEHTSRFDIKQATGLSINKIRHCIEMLINRGYIKANIFCHTQTIELR